MGGLPERGGICKPPPNPANGGKAGFSTLSAWLAIRSPIQHKRQAIRRNIRQRSVCVSFSCLSFLLPSVCPCLSFLPCLPCLSFCPAFSAILSNWQPFTFFRFFRSWYAPFFLAMFIFWLVYAVFYRLEIFLNFLKKSVDKREILYYNRQCQQDMKTADTAHLPRKKEFEKILKKLLTSG